MVTRGSFLGSKVAGGAELTNHSDLVLTLTTSAAMAVFPLCHFMACTETVPCMFTCKIWKSRSLLLWDVVTHHWVVVTQNFQINTLSWKVRCQITSDAEPHPCKTKTATTPVQKPKIFETQPYKSNIINPDSDLIINQNMLGFEWIIIV
jgi:hypothetical protein